MSFNHPSIARPAFPVTITAGQTVGTATAALNGLLRGVSVKSAALDAGATITVAIADSDGVTVYSKAAIATAAAAKTFLGLDANNVPLQVPLSGTHTITVTASGTSATDKIETVSLLIQK